MADATPLSDAERAKLVARRDRLMKLLNANDGADELDVDDREDLAREWTKIDNLLNRSR